MALKPLDDDGMEVETDLLFTRPARTVLGKRRFRWFHWSQRVQPVVLIGRNVTSDTQTLDPLFTAAGKLPSDGGFLGSGTAVGNTASAWNQDIGVAAWFTTGSIAGNANATLPTLAPSFGDSIFSIEQILHVLDCDATAASRVPTLTIVAGMPSIVTTLNDWSQVGATSTTTENSKLFVPRGPAVVKINDNGTITDGATSPLPMSIADGGVISVAVAAGVVGDAHSLSALVRRIA